jgi:hypothetical protein
MRVALSSGRGCAPMNFTGIVFRVDSKRVAQRKYVTFVKVA